MPEAKPVDAIPDPDYRREKSAPRIKLEAMLDEIMSNPGAPYKFTTEATANQGRNLMTASRQGGLKPKTGTLRVNMRRNDGLSPSGEPLYDLYATYTTT